MKTPTFYFNNDWDEGGRIMLRLQLVDKMIEERTKNPHVDQVLMWEDPLIEEEWLIYATKLADSGEGTIINLTPIVSSK